MVSALFTLLVNGCVVYGLAGWVTGRITREVQRTQSEVLEKHTEILRRMAQDGTTMREMRRAQRETQVMVQELAAEVRALAESTVQEAVNA
jgi:uncharacterized protein (UPF0147 family)